MICSRCLRTRATRSLLSKTPLLRQFSTTLPSHSAETVPAASTPPRAPSITQPLSTPPTSSEAPSVKFGTPIQPKPKSAIPLPVSSCPAGTILKGLNYLKGRDDPVALKEEEYPEWLWRCLDVKKKVEGEEDVGDEFSKSKKVRRATAKRLRKLEAAALASGDLSALTPKIPITQQSIDLPANEEGTVEGAIEAEERRRELKSAMRKERRSKIKEANYLKGM